MSWLRRRRQAEEDQRELERAERQLEQVRRQWPAVHRAAQRLTEHGQRNGFAQAIRDAMGVVGNQ